MDYLTTDDSDRPLSSVVNGPSSMVYFVSRWETCLWQRGQYFFNSMRPWVFFRFFSVVYVRSLHSVQASVTVIRFAFLEVAIFTSLQVECRRLKIAGYIFNLQPSTIPESW